MAGRWLRQGKKRWSEAMSARWRRRSVAHHRCCRMVFDHCQGWDKTPCPTELAATKARRLHRFPSKLDVYSA